MRRALAAAALGAALGGCAKPAPPPEGPVEIRLGWEGGEGMAGCRVEADGRAMTDETLIAAARGWRGRGARIVGGLDTPYKCIGGVILTLQRAGMKRIGFISEPPPDEPEG